MKKRFKVLISFIVAFTMIFTMGVTSISGMVEDIGEGIIQNDIIKEDIELEEKTVTEDVYEETPQVPDVTPAPTQDPEKPLDVITGEGEGTVVEDVYKVEIVGTPSINAFVSTDRELYEFGDTLIYNLVLVNNGEVDLKDILISDDLNGQYSVDNLAAGEEKVVTKEYFIDPESGLEEISNSIYISTVFNEEEIYIETGFNVGFVEYLGESTPVEEMLMMRTTDFSLMSERTNNRIYQDTIDVFKTADRIKPGCRLYEIILGINGTPPKIPVDVVLVIDRSGSMSSNPMTNAKAAAQQFANKVLGNGNPNNNRISIVSYATSASKDKGWTNDLSSITTKINELKASGNTNIHDGFRKAEELIDTARQNTSKAIVLLSDGVANRYMEYNWFWGWQTGSSATNPTSHTNSTIAAYQKGQELQPKANIFTIGLLNKLSGANKVVAEETLQWSAQIGNYYNAPSPEDLTEIYEKISTQINSSATNAVVVDKIGDDFDLVETSLPSGATYNQITREITWTPGTIGTYAELKYQVRAKSTFLGGLADTNEYANLTYTDVNGNTGKTKEFPVPNVDVPAPLSINLTGASIIKPNSITLGTGTDPNGENYMSDITGGDGNGTFTYEWRISGDSNVFSSVKNPEVSPSVDTIYQLTVIDSNGCKAIAKMTVKVEDPKGSITITKVVENPKSQDADLEFDIVIDGPDGTKYVVTLKNNESQTLNNLKLGEYTINEVVPMNYKLVGISKTNITLTLENRDDSSTVTNKPSNGGWFNDDDTRKNTFKVGVVTIYGESTIPKKVNIPENKDEQ